MAEKRWILPVSSDTRVRHYHRTDEGKVAEFSLQLEVRYEAEWRVVIRYDTAHGFAHVDRYNVEGVQWKERLELPFDDALTRAERDLKRNWRGYRERFLRGGYP